MNPLSSTLIASTLAFGSPGTHASQEIGSGIRYSIRDMASSGGIYFGESLVYQRGVRNQWNLSNSREGNGREELRTYKKTQEIIRGAVKQLLPGDPLFWDEEGVVSRTRYLGYRIPFYGDTNTKVMGVLYQYRPSMPSTVQRTTINGVGFVIMIPWK